MALLVLLPLGILVVLGLLAYKLARGDKGTRRVVVDYNERLKQADELYEKAKGAYQQAMRLPAGDGRNQGLRGAIRVIGEARDLFHEIREKHPGERYRNLDERIADLQSLLKICRDNLTLSSSGSAPASPKDSDDKPQGIRYEDLPKGEPVYTK